MKRIAIDIDEVLAEHMEFVRQYVNEVRGVNLSSEDYKVKIDEYEFYFCTIWERSGIDSGDDLMKEIHERYEIDQSFVELVEGAKEAVDVLKNHFELYAVSSRPLNQQRATQEWAVKGFGDDFQDVVCLGNHHNHDRGYSKGDYCKKIGASWLVDDNLKHCLSAIKHGSKAIMFGDYGWQIESKVPKTWPWLKNWAEVTEFLLDEADSQR
jgi:FMN phosphatase YigB (HAD superfamily)